MSVTAECVTEPHERRQELRAECHRSMPMIIAQAVMMMGRSRV
jgi:hypothetical protein